MDKRFNPVSLREQLEWRRKALEEVSTHPEWPLAKSILHLKKANRLTSAELARLSGVGFRTLQDIEQGRSEGTVQTINKILSVFGLRLGVVSPNNDKKDVFDPSRQ